MKVVCPSDISTQKYHYYPDKHLQIVKSLSSSLQNPLSMNNQKIVNSKCASQKGDFPVCVYGKFQDTYFKQCVWII